LFGWQRLLGHHQEVDVAAVGVEAIRCPGAVQVHAEQVVVQDRRKILGQVLGEADSAHGGFTHRR
jgi:hypothetical protein